MNAARTLLCLLLILAVSGTVYAQTTRPAEKQDDKNSPLYWLKLAEAQVVNIEDTTLKENALERLVIFYGGLDRIDFALSCFNAEANKDVANGRFLRPSLCGILAEEGKYDEALSLAKSTLDKDVRSEAMSTVAWILIAKKGNIKKAIEIAEGLPSQHRGMIYAKVVKLAASRNDFKTARQYMALIEEEFWKSMSEDSIKLAELIKAHGSIEAVLKDAPDKLKNIEYGLKDWAKDCIKKGKLDVAAKIAPFIQDYEYQSRIYANIALVWHEKGDKAKYKHFISKAIAAAKKEWDGNLSSDYFADIAKTQLEAKDINGAAKTVELVIAAAKASPDQLALKYGISEIVELLLAVGKEEQADELVEEATDENYIVIISKYTEHYTVTGNDKALKKYLFPLDEPEQLSSAYIGIAQGLMKLQKEKEAKKKAAEKKKAS